MFVYDSKMTVSQGANQRWFNRSSKIKTLLMNFAIAEIVKLFN